MMPNVKICGITNLEDAQVAAAAGADYLGFIFYPPSKRAITPEAAQGIAARLREGERCPILVGVFVDETAADAAAILDTCGLDLAQLSGDETPNMIGDPASPLYGRSYKALRPTTFAEADAEAEWYLPPPFTNKQTNQPTNQSSNSPSLLLDTYHPTLRGGTGETMDWSVAARLAETVDGLMLAGGLTPENVAAAVRQVRPFAVDVASGVEAVPGRKDHARIRAFIRAAKAALKSDFSQNEYSE